MLPTKKNTNTGKLETRNSEITGKTLRQTLPKINWNKFWKKIIKVYRHFWIFVLRPTLKNKSLKTT